jgi:putative MFS transporter
VGTVAASSCSPSRSARSVMRSRCCSPPSPLGYPLGSALSLPIVERVERRFLVIGTGLAMAVFGLAFGYSGSMAMVLIFGFLYTATSNVFSNAFHIYQAEIFPTALRSTASSGTYSLSRLATAAMPFVLVPLLEAAGPNWMFLTVALLNAAVEGVGRPALKRADRLLVPLMSSE